jgi:hypothetical protein
LPELPDKRSLPELPEITSLPEEPDTTSLPVDPFRRSLPELPLIRSLASSARAVAPHACLAKAGTWHGSLTASTVCVSDA